MSDCAISSKKIPESDWNLVFTRLGRYFFYNSQNGERSWIPPRNILSLIKEKFTPVKREMFFDPFYIEDEDCEDVSESETESQDFSDEPKTKESSDEPVTEAETDNKDHSAVHITHKTQSQSHTQSQAQSHFDDSEDQFKFYLLKNEVDPFAPWPKILSLHSTSPEFRAVPSDKRRQDLFAQVCPLLIDQRREINRKKVEEAKQWWQEIKKENWRTNCPWFQLLKRIKGNPKFALLNEKECEKEYKNKK